MTTPPHLAAGSTGSTGSAPKNPDLAGHRRRMRDKVIDKSAANLTELELLEMILYPSNPRGDAKTMAKRLVRELGSLAGVLRAQVRTSQQLDQVGPAAIAAINVTESSALHLSHSCIKTSRSCATGSMCRIIVSIVWHMNVANILLFYVWTIKTG